MAQLGYGLPEIRSFIRWLLEEHHLTLACLHIHQNTCYDHGKMTCGYPEPDFHPVCADAESLVALFLQCRETSAGGPDHEQQ